MKSQLHTTLVVYFVAVGIFFVGLFISHRLVMEEDFMSAQIPLWTGLMAALVVIFGRMIKVIDS